MMKKLWMIIVVALFAITGCFTQDTVTKKVVQQDGVKSVSDNKIPKEFSFGTSREITVSLDSKELAGNGLAIYAKNRAAGGKILAEDTFDVDGIFTGTIVVPNGVNSIFVKVNGKVQEVAVAGDKVIATVKAGAAKRATVIADPSRYFYEVNCFEDKWPIKGDYDMNDVIVQTEYKATYASRTKDVKSVTVNYKALASGAEYVSGFGLQLDVDKTAVTSITGSNLTENVITLDAKGMEAAQDKPVAIFFDNVKKQFIGAASVAAINTVRGEPYYESIDGQQIVVTFKKDSGVKVDTFAGKLNPFIFRTNNRSIEVHKKGFAPTNLADTSLSNTGDDKSSTEYYQTATGWPWAISIPLDSEYTQFNYPRERQSIETAYLKFLDWATSGGANYPDWYDTNVRGNGYFNYANMYYTQGDLALLSSIQILEVPAKTEYIVGEPLDIIGLVVNGIYDDGTQRIQTVTPNNIVGFDSSVAGSYVITVDIEGKTATYNITVKNNISGRLNGSVKDAQTKLGLAGTAVKVYNGAALLKTAYTDTYGLFTIDVEPGTGFRVEISKADYVTTDIYNVNVIQDQTINLESVLSPKTGANGNISGKVLNALTGYAVSDVQIYIRKGINAKIGNVIAATTTDVNGQYTISSVEPGNYTVEAVKNGYITGYFTAVCLPATTTTQQNGAITPVSLTGLRIVLTWGATPSDLDSHLTGPTADGFSRFHVYYSAKTYLDFANLDVDDTSSYGPETETIYLEKWSTSVVANGVFRYSVHDYSNKSNPSSTVMSNSGAVVKVYDSNGLNETFNVPAGQAGTLWTVFEIRNGSIVPVNTITHNSSPATIQ